MAMWIRACWEQGRTLFDGPVEIDEAFFGGLEKNKHASERPGSDWRTGKTIITAYMEVCYGTLRQATA